MPSVFKEIDRARRAADTVEVVMLISPRTSREWEPRANSERREKSS